MVGCNNTNNNRPWSNVVHRIGVSVNSEQLARSRCLKRVAEDQELYPIDAVTLKDIKFDLSFTSLSACPCSLGQIRRDRRFSFVRNLSLEGNCYVNRFGTSIGGILEFANRCCYDSR